MQSPLNHFRIHLFHLRQIHHFAIQPLQPPVNARYCRLKSESFSGRLSRVDLLNTTICCLDSIRFEYKHTTKQGTIHLHLYIKLSTQGLLFAAKEIKLTHSGPLVALPLTSKDLATIANSSHPRTQLDSRKGDTRIIN